MEDNSMNSALETEDNTEEPSTETQESTPETEDNTPEWKTKFETEEAMWQSYKNLESKFGEKSHEASDYQRMLSDFEAKMSAQGEPAKEDTPRYYDPETQKAFDLIENRFGISKQNKALQEMQQQVLYMQDKQNFDSFKMRNTDLTDAQANLLWKLGANVDGLPDYEKLKREVLDPAIKTAREEAKTTVEKKTRAKGTPAKKSSPGVAGSLLQEFAKLDRSTTSGMKRSIEIMNDPNFEQEKKALREA